MTRARASELAVAAGATVFKSVMRKANVLVVGSLPVKLSNADAGDVETWDEDRFLDAVGNGAGTRHGSSASSGASASGSAAGANSDEDRTVPGRIVLAQYFKEGNGTNPAGWLMSEKLDGMRAFWDSHVGKMWLRQGKAIHAPGWWLASLPRNVYLDGELWLGRGQFQACMRIVRRQDMPRSWNRVRVLVVDVPDNRIVAGGQSQPNSTLEGYEARFKRADSAASAVASASGPASPAASSSSSSSIASAPTFAEMHPFELCRGRDHLAEKLAEVESLGLMLRKAGSTYQPGRRSPDLLKVKSSRHDEAVALAHELGRGWHAGRVGAVRAMNRAGRTFKIGSGFSDAEREDPPPVGTVVTYRCNELMERGTPRFPLFVRVRPDVDADEICEAATTGRG